MDHSETTMDVGNRIPLVESLSNGTEIILYFRGVNDIWGTSDVYRTFNEGGCLPEDCTPLIDGQPLIGRHHDDAVNPELAALPVAWVKNWTGNTGLTSRVFHVTMVSAQDFQSEGLRRLVVNAIYWCLQMLAAIDPKSNMQLVGKYTPPESGFDYVKLNITPQKVGFYR